MGNAVVGDHKRLDVWRLAMDLSEHLYRLTETLPSTERFGLTTQIRKAAVSVPSNIAEGAARGSSKELLRFLAIALGSLAELETQLLLAERLGMLQQIDVTHDIIASVRRMLVRLRQSLLRRL